MLTALARVEALAQGIAQPIATVRHVHLADNPLVLIPLAMAGEANAPLAALVGSSPDDPQLLIVPQPRNRDQRFAFAAQLAEILLPAIDQLTGASEAVPADRGRDTRWRFCEAPQILVPNQRALEFVRLFGRSTRFRRVDGEYPVAPTVPLLGRWLTFFAEKAEYPGTAMLLAMTDVLSLHWATGQSALEDANLAAQLAWIDPGTAANAREAARRAEDPRLCPPAGPTTDPDFDNTRLAPAMEAHDAALARVSAGGQLATSGELVAQQTAAQVGVAQVGAAYRNLERVLRSQLEPTWQLMWRAVELLRRLPAGGHVAERWAEDRDSFTQTSAYFAENEVPQPRRDAAVTAARKLHRMERALGVYTAQRAYDDPLVMAEYRMTGEAFVGVVTVADRLRIDDSGKRRVLRPLLVLVTDDPVRLEPGAVLTCPTRRQQQARVLEISGGDGKTQVTVELFKGIGRALTPPPGAVPEVGQVLCYAALNTAYIPPGAFPTVEETPWTHGGPPEYCQLDPNRPEQTEPGSEPGSEPRFEPRSDGDPNEEWS